MKTLKKFAHVNAKTIDEAASLLQAGHAAVLSGGTDLLGTMRFEVLPTYPEVLVNLKTIPGMEYIKEEGGMLKIGAQTRLEDIAKSALVHKKYTALAEGAHRTATPHIREMGTISGNICQMNRCWYFRNPDNRFNCIRKGGKTCYAMVGDNRYHSIFGAVKMCLAVNPSDTAPALVALNAKIKTNKRLIEAENFWEMTDPWIHNSGRRRDCHGNSSPDARCRLQERFHQIRYSQVHRLPHRELRRHDRERRGPHMPQCRL